MKSGTGRFDERVVLVTGGASGIGAAMVHRFLDEGARVAVCDLNAESLAEFRDGLDVTDDKWFGAAVDVSNATAVERFVDDAVGALGGRLDVMVNNAGTGCFGHIDEVSVEAWHRTFAVNVNGVFHGCRAALPHLRRTRGSIVTIASISGLLADPGLLVYNATKAAVINLTRTLAVDHAHEGVRANCICPGGVDTPMVRAHTRDAHIMEDYARTVPMSRLGTPDEIASAAAFLASHDASYITGVALVVDGGVTALTGQPNFDRLYRERGWDRKLLKFG
jgi:meso-butanediol dehydrogenase / (S,S)-butanediol dehydrogenase / diacetyl reductase